MFFTAQSFADLNERALICIDSIKYNNKSIAKSDCIFAYIFKYSSANYYYSGPMENDMYEIKSLLNVNHRFIKIELEYCNSFINRETLEHSVNNNITAKYAVAKNQKFFLIY